MREKEEKRLTPSNIHVKEKKRKLERDLKEKPLTPSITTSSLLSPSNKATTIFSVAVTCENEIADKLELETSQLVLEVSFHYFNDCSKRPFLN